MHARSHQYTRFSNQKTLEEQEQEWVLAIDESPVGLYRVTVQTESASDKAPTPVHDCLKL